MSLEDQRAKCACVYETRKYNLQTKCIVSNAKHLVHIVTIVL
jgi:hypothetical protein